VSLISCCICESRVALVALVKSNNADGQNACFLFRVERFDNGRDLVTKRVHTLTRDRSGAELRQPLF